MSHYSYMTIPRMEADAVQESTSAAIRRARKIADNLSLRMKTFESDLEIEQNMIRSGGSPEVFTRAVSLSDEVFSSLRNACNELNAASKPPAVEIRTDPETEKKRYYRTVVLPQDQVVSFLTQDAIFVRTPMLWSRNNRRVRGDKGRTIGPEKCTVYRESVYYSIILDPLFPQYDFSGFKKKIFHYLYIYHDLPANRMYLIDNDIYWNHSLTVHEDSYFNCLALNCASKPVYCPTPFYLWKWRDDSVCRRDFKYILKTYNNLIDSNTALVEQLLSRGKDEAASFYIASLVYDAYFTMNKDEWINQENKEYRDATEKRFAEYYRRFKEYASEEQ